MRRLTSRRQGHCDLILCGLADRHWRFGDSCFHLYGVALSLQQVSPTLYVFDEQCGSIQQPVLNLHVRQLNTVFQLLIQPNFAVEQCLPNCFARGPLLASKNNHGFSHLRSRKYRVSGWSASKIKNLCLRTDIRQLPIHTGSIRNSALHGLEVIKLSLAVWIQGVS